MSVQSSSNRYPLDSLTVLRPSGQPAVSVATDSNSIPLDLLATYWDQGTVAEPVFLTAEVIVENLGGSASTPSASFSVNVGGVTLATVANVTTTGRSSVVLDRDAIVAALNGALSGAIQVVATPASNSAVAWNAYLSVLPNT